MSAEEPIDVDAFSDEIKLEEDLYGKQVKSEQDEEPRFTPFLSKPSPSKGKSPRSPNNDSPRRNIHRRHPEDADTEDKILMSLIDRGTSWV